MSDVSVVIPVHDGGARLGEAVASVLAQEPAPVRVVVVDDRSSDGAPQAVGAAHPAVDVIPSPAPGPGAARNAGLRACDTPLVAFLDADDRWLPGHVADLLDVRRAVPDAALLATAYASVRTGDPDPGPSGAHRPQRVDYFRRAATDPGFVWTGAAAVDREAALACGGFGDTPAGEDLVLWVRLALEHPVGWTPRVSALYVRGTGGVMESTAARPAPSAAAISGLAELSPALGVADEALRGEPADRDALAAYVNGRVTLAACGALLAGDARGVERLRSLRVTGPRPSSGRPLLDAVVDLPPVLLRPAAAVLAAGAAGRRRVRWRRP